LCGLLLRTRFRTKQNAPCLHIVCKSVHLFVLPSLYDHITIETDVLLNFSAVVHELFDYTHTHTHTHTHIYNPAVTFTRTQV